MELQKREEEKETTEEIIPYPESSLSHNTKSIAMSSTTVRTPEARVGASTSRDCENTLQHPTTPKKSIGGQTRKSVTFQKENSSSAKRQIIDLSEDKEYIPGTLYKNAVEEESKPEIEVPMPSKKKSLMMKRRRLSEEEQSQDEESEKEEDFSCMVANLARAHSLVQNTGKIFQTISIKEDDGYINISPPGEHGLNLIKLALYPFKDCARLTKNRYWTKRTFTSLAVISGEDSPVYKSAMKLRKLITQQVMSLDNIKVEKKSQTGWKSF
ncbi:unnamed protein product, partial [Brenthis ino]